MYDPRPHLHWMEILRFSSDCLLRPCVEPQLTWGVAERSVDEDGKTGATWGRCMSKGSSEMRKAIVAFYHAYLELATREAFAPPVLVTSAAHLGPCAINAVPGQAGSSGPVSH